MHTSELCAECQQKVPILDLDAVVELIRRTISMQEAVEKFKHELTTIPLYFYINQLTRLARLAHKAAGSTMKGGEDDN